MVSTAANQEARPGSNPRTALREIKVSPIPFNVGKRVLTQAHYLHSEPGGTQLMLGVFYRDRLEGVITLGVGPKNVHRLVDGAVPADSLTLSRMILSEMLPANSESRVVSVVLRHLKKETSVKFVATYADPSAGHVGTIYQASNWLYIGTSTAMPLLDLGDGRARHSRSLAHEFGTHSRKYFEDRGINVRRIPQAAKHRYIYFLDRSWRDRLLAPVLPYPKKGDQDECG